MTFDLSKLQLIGLGGLLLAIPCGARAADCDKVMSSMSAIFKQPSASEATIAEPGLPVTHGRTIYDGTKIYVQVDGKWHNSPMTVQETIDRMNESRKKAKSTCDTAGTETVDGVTATVYTVHSVTERGTSDTRLWVVDSSGLPLKAETRFTSGMTMNQTFQYTGIETPADVQ